MNTVFLNPEMDDDRRRQELFRGNIVAYAPTKASMALCQFARELAEEHFHPFHPQQAQHHMPVDRYVEILGRLKPLFINHPRSKQLLREMLCEFGCDEQETYFDVPRLRTSTSSGYLTSGLAYAYHPHRDTWFSAPHCQLNWWLAVYDVAPTNCLAIHPQYWNNPVKNGSSDFDYHEWVSNGRKNASRHVKQDTRKQPHPEEPLELEPSLRTVTPAGGVFLFSAAHLHSSVVNTSGCTRISIDFRTVHLRDVARQDGAPNLDSRCHGTNLGDFLRVGDLQHVPMDYVARYDNAPREVEAIAR